MIADYQDLKYKKVGESYTLDLLLIKYYLHAKAFNMI